jgi:hypothetical protein
MAKIELHPDFKDFLRLLNSHRVEYLLVGGYAVGYHGYPHATGDMDIWIAVSETNAQKAAVVFRNFGMPEEKVSKQLFHNNGIKRYLKKPRFFRPLIPYTSDGS